MRFVSDRFKTSTNINWSTTSTIVVIISTVVVVITAIVVIISTVIVVVTTVVTITRFSVENEIPQFEVWKSTLLRASASVVLQPR
jgi:uncharacterized Tic20 family protein